MNRDERRYRYADFSENIFRVLYIDLGYGQYGRKFCDDLRQLDSDGRLDRNVSISTGLRMCH